MGDLKVNIKDEKKEVGKMEKVLMNEVTEAVLLDILKTNDCGVDIPRNVICLDYKVDEYKANDGTMKPWGHIYVTDKEKYDLLKSVGLEKNAFVLTIKLANYEGESLERLKNKILDLTDVDLVFNLSKFKKIEGLSYRDELENIKVVG